MIDPLFVKSMRDLRGQTLGWGLGLGIMLAIVVALFPEISQIYSEIEFPAEMMAFFGQNADLSTIEGWLTLEFFSYGALVLAVFAVMAGSGAALSEETDGTMDTLFSHPVSRGRLLFAKITALVISMGLAILIMLVLTLLAGQPAGVNMPVMRLLLAFALLWQYEIAVIVVTLALALANRRLSSVLVAFVLVGSWMLNGMSGLAPDLVPLRPFLTIRYYQAEAAMIGEVDLAMVIALGLVAGVAVAAAAVLFERREIGSRGRLPTLPWKRKGANPVR